MTKKFVATKTDQDLTVGFFLLKNNVSKRLITKLKREPNGILKNNTHARTVDLISAGDIVEINFQDEKRLDPNPDLDVEIAFENEDFVVFNKPPFMPVHPSIKHQGDTLGNYFAYLYPHLTFRPVNRLDRDTSGLCVVAKNPLYAKLLQFSVKKTYYAIATGEISQNGTIDAPIARETESIITRIVSPNGQHAVTHFKPLKISNHNTLVEIQLETGRTHQIRVHFAHIGHPLVGDDLYGEKSDLINRHALHCGKLEIILPNEKPLEIFKNLPDDMQRLMSD